MNNQHNKRYKNKNSYGICCFRYNQNKKKYEILLIKKRYTYAYCDFIKGEYSYDIKKNNFTELIKLFNNMTVHEKILILSKNFEQIWYHLHLVQFNKDNLIYNPIKNPNFKFSYMKKKEKFEELCRIGNGSKLNELINNSTNIECLWEIPKGRKETNESDLCCAIREFKEETGIKKKNYYLLFNIGKNEDYFIYHHINNKVKYMNYYYAAIIKDKYINKELTYKFNSKQVYEIADIKYFTIEEIRELPEKDRILSVAENMLKIVKRRLKIYMNNNLEEYHENIIF